MSAVILFRLYEYFIREGTWESGVLGYRFCLAVDTLSFTDLLTPFDPQFLWLNSNEKDIYF